MGEKISDTFNKKYFVLCQMKRVEFNLGIVNCAFQLALNRVNPWVYLFEHYKLIWLNRSQE